MPPSATILFIAEEDPSIAVLAAHLLAIASQDHLRTAAVTVLPPQPTQPIVRRLLLENLMPNWWLPYPERLDSLPAHLSDADVIVVLNTGYEPAAQRAAPRACLTNWRRLYGAITQRTELLASLSPQSLGQLHANPKATGRVLRMPGM